MDSDPVLFEVAALTHRGAVRAHNEDAIAVGETVLMGDMGERLVERLRPGRHLLLVADGMGGHAFGELASRTAVEALVANRDSLADIAGCRAAIAAANASIYEAMRRRPEAFGMGTTVVGAVLGRGELLHFNVGDSRAYRHSADGLRQISHDDVPGAAGAGRGRVSHVVTQCLGGFPADAEIEPHVAAAPPLAPGEVLLLCSDGLTDMVGDADIARALKDIREPGRCAMALFEMALEEGGIDNVSIIIARAVAD